MFILTKSQTFVFAVCVVTLVVHNILWFLLQIISMRKGERFHLYMTRCNIAKLKHLFVNLSDPDHRRRYMFILNIFKVSLYVFGISCVLLLVLFLGHAYYQGSLE